MSGPSRMMCQYLESRPEGTIFSKRSKPQGTNSSPHDTAASMAERLEMNIQGTRWTRQITGSVDLSEMDCIARRQAHDFRQVSPCKKWGLSLRVSRRLSHFCSGL